ncbi:MAG: sulfatase family protein, partial [Planctomycetota bacterium]
YDTLGGLSNPLVNTPHVDRLMAEGAAFTHAYCQSPVCTPSRASFLTGRYPRTNRCRQNGQTIPADERLLPRIFADHGYTCGLAGKLHLASCSEGKIEQRIDDGYDTFHWSHHPQDDWGDANAYTKWLREKGHAWDDLYDGALDGPIKPGPPAELHQTTWCAEKTIEFIRDNANTTDKPTKPWMFSFNCFDPHHPFDPPADYLARYNPDDMPLPKFRPGELESKTTYQQRDHASVRDGVASYNFNELSDHDKRRITAAYYAMCELIDDQVGRILRVLEETGQARNTLVIFMSDHGEMLGDHGFYLKGPHFYEEAIRVPMVIRWPSYINPGTRIDGLVELIDLAPTLLESAGIEVPEAMQGRSLLPLMTGQANPDHFRGHVFCEYDNSWSHKRSYGSMLRTTTHKIVVYHGTDQGELYDLQSDPDEFDNLWNDPASQSLKLDLMKRCFDASVLTMDPTPPRLGEF